MYIRGVDMDEALDKILGEKPGGVEYQGPEGLGGSGAPLNIDKPQKLEAALNTGVKGNEPSTTQKPKRKKTVEVDN